MAANREETVWLRSLLASVSFSVSVRTLRPGLPGAHLDNRTQAEREKPKSAVFRGGGPGEIRGLRKRGTARENKKRLIRPVARRREAPWVPEGTRKVSWSQDGAVRHVSLRAMKVQPNMMRARARIEKKIKRRRA